MSTKNAQLSASEMSLEREQVFNTFRQWGYVDANLYPFGGPIAGGFPDLRQAGEWVEEARKAYCGSVGAEFMHLPQRDRREWIQERMENPPPQKVDRAWLTQR